MKKSYLVLACLLTAGALVGCSKKSGTSSAVSSTFSRTSVTTSVSEGPAVCDPIDLYLRGAMNSWGADESYLLTAKEEGSCVYTISNIMINAGTQFKFGDEGWGVSYFTFADAEQTNFENVGDGYGGSNINCLVAGVYSFEVDTDKDAITFTYAEPTKTLTSITGTFQIGGAYNGWTMEDMTAEEDGTYTYSLTNAAASTQFYIHAADGVNHYSDDSADDPSDIYYSNNGANYTITGNGIYKVTLSPMAEEPVTWEKTGDCEIAAFDLYLRGSVVDASWSASDAYKFTQDTEDTTKYTLTVTFTADDVDKEFKVADASWGHEMAFSALTVGEDASFTDNSGNIKIAKAGTYTFTAVCGDTNSLTYVVSTAD